MPTTVVSLSELKARAAQMLAEMRATEHEIVLTQRGAASAAAQDSPHQRQRSALLMLTLMVQAEADIQAGRTTPQDRVFAGIKARSTAPTDRAAIPPRETPR